MPGFLIRTLITAIGLYAVVSQFVSGYGPALGIRRALGARPVHLVPLVLRRVTWMLGIGLVAGIVLARLAEGYIRAELVGVRFGDPSTWAGTLAVLAVLVLAAVLLPTRRALSVSPVSALRSD